jgi:hypothetical protein
MKILIANWRAALSRGLPWWVALVVVSLGIWLALGWTEGVDSFGHRVSLLPWVLLVPLFWLTIAFGFFQSRTLLKPLSACLPGYRQSLRFSYLSVELPLALVLSSVLSQMILSSLDVRRMMSFQTHSFFEAVVATLATFLAVTTIGYFTLSLPLLFSKRMSTVLMFLTAPLYMAWFAVMIAVSIAPVLVLLVVVCVCPAILVFTWVRLGDMERVGCYHRAMIDHAAHRRVKFRVRGPSLPALGEFFLRPMQWCGPLTSGQRLWGCLYETLGLVLCDWRRLLIWSFIAAPMLVYVGPFANGFALLLLVPIILTTTGPLTSNLLLPLGRRQKYHAMVVASLALSLLLVVIATVVVVSCHFLLPLLPKALGIQHSISCLWALYLPGLLLPVLFGLLLFEHKDSTVGHGIILVAAIAFIMAAVFYYREIAQWGGVSVPILFAAIFLAGWIFFVLALRRACTRWSLIAPRRRGAGALGGGL